ncbi:hypothetical protein AVEN_77986-1 [Araneus ventricosus]|uniref:HAT C-terminal dimerisation domain-containing protein n=1 Tax=Araneus ventricosus TaxID=182803 RepID=A0A4Y2MEM5_ARAVE|nr:hypothetical protein AVEN_77986-1 [Araneus ventricosus]
MFERSPIKFKLTEGISCLDPAVAMNETLASKRLSSCLEILLANNWISGNEADKIDFQFKSILKSPGVNDLLKAYNRSSRLDHFWLNIIDSGHEFQEFKNFCQFVLILSHGNATVERGFSINKECLIHNQTEESLIALRSVHDAVVTAGGISAVKINKDLVHSARNAHGFYTEALKHKEKLEEMHNQQKFEKKIAEKKLKELQLKKVKLLADAEKQVSLINEEMKLFKK